jgi:hypothetical protein
LLPVLARLLQAAKGLVTFVGPGVGILIDAGSEIVGFGALSHDVVLLRTVDLNESRLDRVRVIPSRLSATQVS